MPLAMSRRTLLLGSGVVAAGAVAGAVPLVVAASAAAAPLTAEQLAPLVGRGVDVRWPLGRGTAQVLALRGTGDAAARGRAFELSLAGPAPLEPSGETIVLSHASLGAHHLFAVPDRDASVWVVVVLEAPRARG
jgi:hypothetical protein